MILKFGKPCLARSIPQMALLIFGSKTQTVIGRCASQDGKREGLSGLGQPQGKQAENLPQRDALPPLVSFHRPCVGGCELSGWPCPQVCVVQGSRGHGVLGRERGIDGWQGGQARFLQARQDFAAY